MTRRLTDCTNTSPIIRQFHHLIRSKHIRTGMIAARAKIRQDTFRTWFNHERNPTVKNLESALAAIGYRLEIVKIEDG